MRWFRVTRYDPAFRDELGAYTRVTWTSVSDVGRTFDDEVLSVDEYERVERLYLDAVGSFAARAGVEAFEATEVSGGNGPDGRPLEDGQRLTLDDACTVVRSMLREEAWCQLRGADVPFSVHVGYDLYMFIGTSGPTEDAVRAVRASGLFVDEDFLSPYAESPTLEDVRRLLDAPVDTVDDLAGLVATIDDAVAARNVEPGWDLAVWMLASGSEDLEIPNQLVRQQELRELPAGDDGPLWIREVLDGLAGALDAWLLSDDTGPGGRLAGPEFSASARQLLQDFEPHVPATGDDVERLREALAPAVAEVSALGPAGTRWLLRHVVEELDVVDAMTSEADEAGDTLPDDPADRFRDALDMARFAVLGVRPTAMLDR